MNKKMNTLIDIQIHFYIYIHIQSISKYMYTQYHIVIYIYIHVYIYIHISMYMHICILWYPGYCSNADSLSYARFEPRQHGIRKASRHKRNSNKNAELQTNTSLNRQIIYKSAAFSWVTFPNNISYHHFLRSIQGNHTAVCLLSTQIGFGVGKLYIYILYQRIIYVYYLYTYIFIIGTIWYNIHDYHSPLVFVQIGLTKTWCYMRFDPCLRSTTGNLGAMIRRFATMAAW